MSHWTNLESWARYRVGVSLDDVVAQYRKEGLLLSDTPNSENLWHVSGHATWGGAEPAFRPEFIENQRRAEEAFRSNWDGSIGSVVSPNGRRVRIQKLEKNPEGELMARLFREDVQPSDADLVVVDELMADGSVVEMNLAFFSGPYPE